MKKEQSLISVQQWLTKRFARVDWIDHQDGMWCLASCFSVASLIELYDTPGALPKRRDQILFAIGLHVEQLLTPWEECSEKEESERQMALDFCRANWNEMTRIDREFGFGDEFETYVVPEMRKPT